jgi:diguanylate cyclase (GGDEF)-like protein
MKILLVEDVRAIAAVMKMRLNAIGHEVVLAENGLIASDKFREMQPDLVFMDIEMPVMNGIEATNKIRAYEATQKWAWTPIIFLTASDKQENLIMAIEAGGDDYLIKGLSEDVLYAKMKAMGRIAAMRQQLSIANQKLEQQASCDGLTGLFNRRWMDMHVDQEWAIAIEKNGPFALLMIDVDNFKKYNDRYGHQSGDDCLRAVAGAIEEAVVKSNAEGLTRNAFAARYGGEEFAVILPGASTEAFETCASRVIGYVQRLAIPHEQNAAWGIATVSVGGCRKEVAEGAAVSVFRAADAALYRAKEGGRNRVELTGLRAGRQNP